MSIKLPTNDTGSLAEIAQLAMNKLNNEQQLDVLNRTFESSLKANKDRVASAMVSLLFGVWVDVLPESKEESFLSLIRWLERMWGRTTDRSDKFTLMTRASIAGKLGELWDPSAIEQYGASNHAFDTIMRLMGGARYHSNKVNVDLFVSAVRTRLETNNVSLDKLRFWVGRSSYHNCEELLPELARARAKTGGIELAIADMKSDAERATVRTPDDPTR